MPPSIRHQTIGAISRHTGCHVETIRYYERIGLLNEPVRTAGGHRTYSSEDFRRLGFVCRARELGFSISEIRELLGFTDNGVSCPQVREILVNHVQEVRRKIADLERLAVTLSATADKCSGEAGDPCPIIDALYEQALPSAAV
jgi:MerR family mercuric resistance operon transcriptional regulator